MSIKIAEAHKGCKLCSNYRAQRYCPRTGKDICWHCCNERRIDRKCPLECAYILQNAENTNLEVIPQQAKVDSIEELRDLIKRLFDIWCESPAVNFADRIPSELAKTEDGRKLLEEYLSSIKQYNMLPLDYIARRLKLKSSFGKEKTNRSPEIAYEDIAGNYLKTLVAHDWYGSIEYLFDKAKYSEELYRKNYISRRQDNRLVKITSSYHLLISAISENREEAMVYFEINNKYDLTVILGNSKGTWLVRELIVGSPSFYYGEREAIILISGFISQQEMSKARQYLDKYSEILIDSADLHYMNGLYSLLTRDYSTSLKHYLTAVEIDPEFYEYKYNLALVYQMLQQFDLAEKLYGELLTQKEDDINVLNNLSVIYDASGRNKEALELLAKCLEIDPNSELAKQNIERIKSKDSR